MPFSKRILENDNNSSNKSCPFRIFRNRIRLLSLETPIFYSSFPFGFQLLLPNA
ncbi:hypothetical protein LEP1GSC179_2715 [Leptospira santarosai str. MOR084]|uniref:Uncharacterized protein n=1 Tax=Leptospira santarosai str. MOR084 TaxID=1049984 RepID=A0A0E2BPT4_9LEPT|nr:hypothetical protein LEP1GSC179_2715 [Leptospira santarosai str. MOR084]